MAEPIRFFMDQHFPGPASRGLQRHGVDLLTSQEAGTCGTSDIDLLALATSMNRVVATFDSDFLQLHQSGLVHAGIVWCPESKYSIGQLIQAVLLLHGVLDADSMRSHVEYL